jgi:hypothetical protein
VIHVKHLRPRQAGRSGALPVFHVKHASARLPMLYGAGHAIGFDF